LIEAAAKRDIRYILCSNESSAATMAGVYSAMRFRPGVVSTGVGPGAAAAALGVAHLFLERSPVLVLTDRYGEAEFRRLPRQRLEHDQLFRPITKGTFTISALDAAATMRRALELSLDGRPGPVHVDLPYDVMLAAAEESHFPKGAVRRRFSTDAVPSGFSAVADAIHAAKRPAVIAGLQIGRRGIAAERALAQFVEKLGAPVLASLGAKGTLPENHPLAAGVFRGVASETALLEKADLFLLIGFDPVEIFTPGVWRYNAPVISIDETPFREGPYVPAIEVIAGIETALSRLTDLVMPGSGWTREDIESYNSRRQSALLKRSDAGVHPAAVVRLTREILPDDGILTVDAGQHKVVTSDLWEARRARGFFSSSGLGTMAVSIPAAIAAKLLEPKAPVVCFTGDGGFLMRVGDLETAAREQTPIVVVVFNDRLLNLVKLQQDRRGLRNLGVSFANSDFAAIARGFGFAARRVETEPEYAAALAEALGSGRPFLIDVAIDPNGYI
ncbi:MAG TPA: thiamine pyrophosphate-binding protein, partial [Terriglobia bacterium]|nr:thiamine pyrophosphate-binding protein [Terriglobia bacterium]